MKGVSSLVAHAIYTALSIIVLGSFIVYAATMRNDMNQQTVDAQLSVIAESVKEDVTRLYLISKDSDFPYDEEVVIAEFNLDFPKSLGGRSYTVSLADDKITVSSTTSEGIAVDVSRDINLDITLKGSSNMPAHLELIRDESGDTIEVASNG